MSDYYIGLKWGTLKCWNIPEDDNLRSLFEKFLENSSMSAMLDKPEKDRKEILCEIIDMFDGRIYSDWTGEDFTKEEAKKYIMEYGK